MYFLHASSCPLQVIVDLYKGFPERVGKKLAERKRLGGAKPEPAALGREMEIEKARWRISTLCFYPSPIHINGPLVTSISFNQ